MHIEQKCVQNNLLKLPNDTVVPLDGSIRFSEMHILV